MRMGVVVVVPCCRWIVVQAVDRAGGSVVVVVARGGVASSLLVRRLLLHLECQELLRVERVQGSEVGDLPVQLLDHEGGDQRVQGGAQVRLETGHQLNVSQTRAVGGKIAIFCLKNF